MEKLIRSMKPNKMKKDELAKIIFENQADIIAFYVKKGHDKRFKPTINLLWEKMSHKKFPAALKLIIKRSKKEEEIFLDPGFAVIINGYYEHLRVTKKDSCDDLTDIMSEYYDIIDSLLKKRSKKIGEAVDVAPDVIKELLVIAPSKDYISSDKFVGVYSQKMLRKLYMLAEPADSDIGLTTTKQVRKMFKKLFGEKLLDLIAMHILLEKKEFISKYNERQIAVWNLMTDFALETLESQKKDHIIELLKYYAVRRMDAERKMRGNKSENGDTQHKSGNCDEIMDAARRISLTTIPAEDYPKIAKAVSKSSKKIKKYL